MSSRHPRAGPSGLTKTQQLRQVRSAALMKEYEQRQEASRHQVEPTSRRKYFVDEPKKIDFTKPAMTKAMLGRMKHAEKFRQEYERKQEQTVPLRKIPRRTPAPIGGPRLDREKMPAKRTMPPSAVPPQRTARKISLAGKKAPIPSAIPEKIRELARSMNAQVIQAEPVGEGPIDSIVIPPRAVNENRTTIVSIPQPTISGIDAPTSQVANRSIQVISETLNEQDAAEVVVVQNKLEDLQHARRDFMMTMANVGGNAVQIAEKEKPRYIYNVPDIEGEMFRIQYGRDHPSVVAAREFAQRSMAGIREREAARRLEDEFARAVREPLPEDLRFDLPFERELFREGDTSWEEDEELSVDLSSPRLKASTMDMPINEELYEYSTFDPEELEKFFDVERYPLCPPRKPPPSSREHLHPDLWELEDPWATCGRCPQQDVSDLIRFESP